jgi:hypothetical protein
MNDRGFFMSIAKISTRAAVVGLGVLASLVLTAAPSWAANPGNSSKPTLCLKGRYPGVLLSQQGAAFKGPVQCIIYVARGGQLAGVNAIASPAAEELWTSSFSGFGLKPGSEALVVARYQPSGVTLITAEEFVGGNGEFSGSVPDNICFSLFGEASGIVIEATTAAGTVFQREFPGPTGC